MAAWDRSAAVYRKCVASVWRAAEGTADVDQCLSATFEVQVRWIDSEIRKIASCLFWFLPDVGTYRRRAGCGHCTVVGCADFTEYSRITRPRKGTHEVLQNTNVIDIGELDVVEAGCIEGTFPLCEAMSQG